jgi:2-iminobutanoate/2-iminopropanoate deaminase
VAGRVADRDQQRLLLVARAGKRLLAPGQPVDRVLLVLEQVGQTPVDPDSGQLVEGSIGDQTRRCLDNLAIVAQAAGCGLEDAVRVGIYVTDISTFKDVNEAYATYFGDEPPARSTIGVAALPLGAEVEIDMVLALPD